MCFEGEPARHVGGNGGGEPGALSERLKSEFVPSVARHHVDWLGAEAAVITAAALTLAAGGSLPLATYAAASAETLAVSRPGGQPVTAAELAAWFHNRPELRPQNRFLPDPARLSDIAMLAPPLATGAAHG
jgi:bifunctional ADP-heptose synthase (sugar kinase/adenylyltransferase)